MRDLRTIEDDIKSRWVIYSREYRSAHWDSVMLTKNEIIIEILVSKNPFFISNIYTLNNHLHFFEINPKLKSEITSDEELMEQLKKII